MTGKEAILNFFQMEKWGRERRGEERRKGGKERKGRRKEGTKDTEHSKDQDQLISTWTIVREKEVYNGGGGLVQESRAAFREAKI